MKKIILMVLLASTSICNANTASSETLIGYVPTISEVYLRVFSGGCTEKEDFTFEIREVESRKLITFYRLRPDYCLSFLPTGKTLIFSHRELGLKSGDHFNVTNSIRDSVVW